MIFALCDEESNTIKTIKNYIRDFFVKENIAPTIISFSTGYELLWYLEYNKNIDIIIMDIKMSEIDGLEVAKRIRKQDKKVQIIFLTALAELAIEGYKVDALSYIMKPVNYQEFHDELQRAVDKVLTTNIDYFIARNADGIYKIYINDIYFIRTEKRNTIINMINRDVLNYRKIKDYQFLNGLFFQSHRSFIVNLAYVREVVGLDIVLNDKATTVVPLSKYKRTEFIECLLAIWGGDNPHIILQIRYKCIHCQQLKNSV